VTTWIHVYSFHRDKERDLHRDKERDLVVEQNLKTKNSFPTVNVIKPDGTAVKYKSEVYMVEAFKKFVDETLP
jgi:hypothetical protein